MAFAAYEIAGGDPDVFEGNVGRRGEFAGADFDFAAFDSGEVAGDEEEGNSFCSRASGADGGHWEGRGRLVVVEMVRWRVTHCAGGSQQCQNIVRQFGSPKIITKDAVGNPFLLPIYNIHIPIPLCGRRQIPHITPGTGLRNRQTNPFRPVQNLREDLRLQFRAGILPQRWRSDCEAHEDG